MCTSVTPRRCRGPGLPLRLLCPGDSPPLLSHLISRQLGVQGQGTLSALGLDSLGEARCPLEGQCRAAANGQGLLA